MKKSLSIIMFVVILFGGVHSADGARKTVLSKPPNYLTTNTGLVGYWTLDGKDTVWTSSSAATTLDKSGSNNTGTLTNMNQATAPVPGKVGQGLSFKGSSSYIQLNTPSSLTSLTYPYTISVWFKTSVYVSENIVTLALTDTNSAISILLAGVSASNQYIYAGNTTVRARWQTYPTITLSDGKWHHAVTVRDGSNNAYMYVDGISFSRGTDDYFTPSNLNIGASGNGTRVFNGSIDDVRIYNRALSASEISLLYRAGTAKINTTSDTGNLASGLVGHWTFDGKNTHWTSSTAGTTDDVSGNGNTGTLTSMNQATSPVVGKLGQGLYFNGVNNYVDTISVVSSSTISNSTFSSSFWFKQPSTGAANTVISWGNFTCNINSIAAHKLNCRVDSTTSGSAFTASNVDDNRWHHIVFVSTSTGQVIYLDGVQSGTATETLGNLNANVRIGRLQSGSTGYMQGYIDDVRIYNRALSASEVTQIYQLGVGRVKP